MIEPDVRSVRWDQLPQDHPMQGIHRRRIIGEQMMISQVALDKNSFVPTHAHANEQFVCVVSGSLRFEIGDAGDPDCRTIIVAAGQVLHLPANVPHSALAQEDTVVLDLFAPPSATTGVDRR